MKERERQRKQVSQERSKELARNVDQMLFTFRNAYLHRQKGGTLQQFLINFDITAAGSPELNPGQVQGHRKMVLSADEAFEAEVPLKLAIERMRIQLLSVVYDILANETGKKTDA